jgi:Tol biopolymer transport system component
MVGEKKDRSLLVLIVLIVGAVVAGLVLSWLRKSSRSDRLEAPAVTAGIVSPISITDDLSRGEAVIKRDGEVIGELPNGWGVYKTEVIRADGRYVYLQNCRKEVNGYLLFGVCPRRIFRVTLANNELRNVVNGVRGNIDMAEDVSPDGMWVALGRSEPKRTDGILHVVVKSIEGGEEQSFPASNEYNELGDMHFSPDGLKLAYAMALGKPNDEVGAVYTIDLKTGETKMVAKNTKPNSYLRVKGWKHDGTVDYNEVSL